MFENETYEVILQRMLDRVSDKLDKREGSLIWDTHSPTALELQYLYIELERIIREAYGDTASREYLIKRCAERGITPYTATNAVLKGEFAPTSIEVLGKRFSIGDLNYIVAEKVSAGIYNVQCETTGTIGNQYLGAMIPIDYIDGMETAELTEVLIPGEDEEDTEALRQRYFASFDEKAFGGNVRDYVDKTNAISGVGSTKVTRAWNGDISPSALIPNETVQAWYKSIIDTLPEEAKAWLSSVYTAAIEKKLTTGGTVLLTILNSDFSATSDTLIRVVQEIIDPEESAGEGYGFAPIGHVVTVRSAQPIEIAIKTNLTFAEGYNWENLRQSIENEVESYLLELRKSWADESNLTVRISRIETRLLSITGILDITDTEINGNTDNLALGQYEIPIFGGVEQC